MWPKSETVVVFPLVPVTAGFQTLVAGNIGKPLCDFLRRAGRYEKIVLEVSSYQLEPNILFRPDVACVLNLTPDHLDRHRTLNAYAKAKEKIFMNQTSGDCAVINLDDAWCRKMRTGRAKTVYISTKKTLRNGVFLDKNRSKIRYRCLGKSGFLPLPARLPGLHNIENACAASAMALALKVSPQDISKSLKNFGGVAHRLEDVKRVRGITFINDSKATNVDSTEKALQALSGPLWLILGGQDKGAPYKPLVPRIRKKVKGIYLIGEAAGKIKKDLRGTAPFFHSGTLANAVKDSFLRARRGDSVLLSPACASFDQFKSFEDRGDQFKSRVMELNP
jgi:UDP-N-acetylmuramoylalanine--D-glutamate ligase